MCVIIRWIQIFRHRIITFNKESIGAAFGRAPQGRGAPLWMLSLLNVIILCLNIWIQRIMTPILYSSYMLSYIYIYIYIYITPMDISYLGCGKRLGALLWQQKNLGGRYFGCRKNMGRRYFGCRKNTCARIV